MARAQIMLTEGEWRKATKFSLLMDRPGPLAMTKEEKCGRTLYQWRSPSNFGVVTLGPGKDLASVVANAPIGFRRALLGLNAPEYTDAMDDEVMDLKAWSEFFQPTPMAVVLKRTFASVKLSRLDC